MSDRDLRYADFSEARMPKVDFIGADGRPSNLNYANFSNAMLVDARMIDTKLQEADLNHAQLQGAMLIMTNLSYSDITVAKFGLLAQQELKTLQEKMAESIQDDKLLKRMNSTLIERAENQISIFAASGKDLWEDPYQLERTQLYGFWNGLEATQDKSDYQNKLAAYLLELSC